MASKKQLKISDEEVDDPEFPDSYEVIDEIKSPLNVLWYNLRFNFKDKYPAKMPEDFARDMIKLYSNKDDRVWDGMCGSGIVPRIANSLGREGYGTDINPKAIELAKKHDPENALMYQVGDARNHQPFLMKQPDLIFSSFPFGLNIIGDFKQYSDEPKDISRTKTYPEFYAQIKIVIENYFKTLKAGGIMILDARDRQKDGVYHDIGVVFRNLAVSIGFEIVCRYWYVMIPYRQMTYKHKKSGFKMPMVSAMDAYVFYKPLENSIESSFG